MKHFSKAAAVAALLTATSAQAADLGLYTPEVVPTWWEAGDIFVRIRGEALIPETHTSNWNSSVGFGVLGNSPDLSVQTVAVPELDLSYFLTKNIALETICCLAWTSFHSAGSIAAFGKIGDTDLFPPTVMLQYHFDAGQLKPYLGVGGSYVWFFNESASGPNFSNLNIHSAAAIVVQAGFDYHLAGNWFLNADVKQFFMGTDASVTALGGAKISTHIELDPTVVGAGIGYRFGAALAPLK